MINIKLNEEQKGKAFIYGASAVIVTIGMGTIKILATAVNIAVAFYLRCNYDDAKNGFIYIKDTNGVGIT